MNDYQKQAEDFLKAHDLEFRSVLVGDDCPKFCEDAQAGRDMDKVNTFPRNTHIHGKHYRCTISGKDRGHVAYDFWNSYADEEENAFAFGGFSTDWVAGRGNERWDKYRSGKHLSGPRIKKRNTPTAYDLLACIEKNDPGTFKDFCADFGYNDDSIKAFDVYRAVQEEYSKTRRFFTAAELEELQEVS